ncbi:MAG: hypothetical protein V3T72_07440, partial [Thermoanaerobaculia bacterium]
MRKYLPAISFLIVTVLACHSRPQPGESQPSRRWIDEEPARMLLEKGLQEEELAFTWTFDGSSDLEPWQESRFVD